MSQSRLIDRFSMHLCHYFPPHGYRYQILVRLCIFLNLYLISLYHSTLCQFLLFLPISLLLLRALTLHIAHLPAESTPLVEPPPGHPFPYTHFSTNYERFAAAELTKRLEPKSFKTLGFLLQAIAAGWHHKSPAQLKELGDAVGRERIAIMQ